MKKKLNTSKCSVLNDFDFEAEQCACSQTTASFLCQKRSPPDKSCDSICPDTFWCTGLKWSTTSQFYHCIQQTTVILTSVQQSGVVKLALFFSFLFIVAASFSNGCSNCFFKLLEVMLLVSRVSTAARKLRVENVRVWSTTIEQRQSWVKNSSTINREPFNMLLNNCWRQTMTARNTSSVVATWIAGVGVDMCVSGATWRPHDADLLATPLWHLCFGLKESVALNACIDLI